MLNAEYTLIPGLSLIRVTGRDRTTFLNSFCTNDLARKSPGQGCEAFVTDAKGHILAHVGILTQADALLVLSLVPQAEELIEHWSRYCITEDVQFANLSASSTGIAIYGPDSLRVVADWGVAPTADPWSHAVPGNEFPTLVVRLPIDIGAYLVVVTEGAWPSMQRLLASAGAGEGTGAWFDELRILARLPLFGRDITSDNLPQEVNRNEQAVSFTKGCYLGQETVARIDALGHVNRLLVSLRIPPNATVEPGALVYSDGSERGIGAISSVAWSPERDEYLALAMVRREYAESGTKLTCANATAEVL